MSVWTVHRNRCALVVTLFLALPAFAADEPKSDDPVKPKAALQGYYAIMAKELALSAEQKAKLEAAVAQRTAALAKWDADNAAKLKEHTDAAAKAKAAGDAPAAKAAGAQARALRDARAAISDSATNTLKAMLTPQQQDGYETYSLYSGAMVKFSAAKLSDEQKAKSKTMAAEAAKAITTGQSATEVTKVKNDLAAKIAAEILTAEQRDAVTKAAAEKKKPRTTAAPGATPAAEKKVE